MNDDLRHRAPGKFIQEELAARGWTQNDLARIVTRPLPTINQIVNGKRAILPEMAIELGAAFGTGADIWLSRESAYRLARAERDEEGVKARARLYSFAPIKEMQRRGWITTTNNVHELESELKLLFGIDSLETVKKSRPDSPLTREQRAWFARARQLASAIAVKRNFDPAQSSKLITKLRRYAAYPKEVAHVCETLYDFGIRFVVVEPLDKSRIDGAAFWINGIPAIALSLRYGRIDAFWFTLMHELAHILHKDAVSIDVDLHGKELMPSRMKISIERRADEAATEMLICGDDLQSFISMYSPLYSRIRIIQFANRIKIHPGIIVGQLQHRCELGWNSHRKLLVDVRNAVVGTALTDGWGKSISPGVID